MILVAFFVLGLLLGSFVTVVVTRYDSNKSIVWGRSQCPQCHHMIAWYDNLPIVSFLLLYGKCRSCRSQIGWWYPVTELFVALAFIGVGYAYQLHAFSLGDVVVYSAVFVLLAVILMYDWQTMQIPMTFVWSALTIMVLYLLWQQVSGAVMSDSVYSVLLGGTIGFGFLFLLSAISREKWMGAGDAYIGLIGGLLVGWPEVFFFLTTAFALGACVGMVLLMQKRKNMRSVVPFAPFLIMAIVITIFLPIMYPHVVQYIPYFS
jgi:leader peptidase (prepilin peptidase)/N-methyltransferase